MPRLLFPQPLWIHVEAEYHTLMTPTERSSLAKRLARSVGFDRAGIAPAGPIPRANFLDTWLADGYAGSMTYLHRNRPSRRNPTKLLPGARSVFVLALNYHPPAASNSSPAIPSAAPAKIARYARGRDYHKVVKKMLFVLIDALRDALDKPFDAKACVDTAPILERELAAAAGVGWIGKNTLVLHENIGSYFFLGEILTTLAMEPDPPATDHCGSCTRCLEACPTGAFPNPYVMNAARCISYLTIEHRGAWPEDLRDKADDWLFGCDVCQEVCPYNRDVRPTSVSDFAPHESTENLRPGDVLGWSPEEYQTRLRGTAMKRATLPMWRRNGAVLLGNRRRLSDRDRNTLRKAVRDQDPLVADHARWALNKHETPD